MSEALNAWPYVMAAYGLGVGGTAVLVVASWFAMRRAEARRDRLRGK